MYINTYTYIYIHDTHQYCYSHTESLELISQRPVRSSDLTVYDSDKQSYDHNPNPNSTMTIDSCKVDSCPAILICIQ